MAIGRKGIRRQDTYSPPPLGATQYLLQLTWPLLTELFLSAIRGLDDSIGGQQQTVPFRDGRGTGPFNPASVSVLAKLSSSLSSPKVTDWIKPLARSAAMATPPLQWSAQCQSMFLHLPSQSHWPKLEHDRVFWCFVQRSERGR
jgi:hypothetical protein